MAPIKKLSTAITKLPNIQEKTTLAIHDYIGNITNRNTADAVEYTLRDLLTFRPLRGAFEENFSLARLIAYRDHLLEKGSSPATLHVRFKLLNGFCKHMLAEDVIPRNHVERVKLPPMENIKQTEALSRDEVARLFAALDPKTPDDLAHKAALSILFTLGLRVSELCSLKWSDFTEDSEGDWFLSYKQKGGRMRVVYLPNYLQKGLERYRSKWEKMTGLKLGEDDMLLQMHWHYKRAKQDGPVNRSTISRKLKALSKAAGLGKIVTPHMARATVITTLLDQGSDLRDVMDIIGHKSVETTKRYDSGNQQAQRKALNKLRLG